jgi:UDP-N-acetylglucosamine transferase subunit ALG13
MIFVTVGTNEAPFDRLIRAVGGLPSTEEIVVQYGASVVRPQSAELVDFLAFERVVEHMRRARLVVTHAGVGSVMVSLANGKRPIVVPRRRSFGEAVDDHQLQLGRRFAEAGLVTLVEDAATLADVVQSAPQTAALAATSSLLATDLRGFLEANMAGEPSSVLA